MFVKCFLKDRVVLVNVGSFRTHVHVLISDDRSTTRSYLLRVYLKILRRDVAPIGGTYPRVSMPARYSQSCFVQYQPGF